MESHKQTLTGIQKDKIRAGAAAKTVEELREAADWFFGNDLPEHGNYVRYLIAQRQANGYAYRPDAAQEPRSRPRRENAPAVESRPLITHDQAKAVVLAGAVLTGGGVTVAYVIIPAALALGSFLVSIAPYIGLGLLAVAGLLSLRGGEKKTENQSGGQAGRRIVVTQTQTTEIFDA